jgi:hypothetical protein
MFGQSFIALVFLVLASPTCLFAVEAVEAAQQELEQLGSVRALS